MADIAKLELQIDSEQAKQATQQLEQFEEAAGGAEDATKKLGDENEKASQKVRANVLAVTAAVTAVTLYVRSVINADDKIGKMADRLNISTEALSQYRHVAELTGVTNETVTMGFQRMSRMISEAAQGGGEAVAALDELGLSAQALNELKIDQQFEIISDAMLGVTNEADKTRLAVKLFDSGGVALLQTMKGGSAAIREMRDEADQLGLTVSQEAAEAAAEFNDRLTRLQALASGTGRTLAHQLMPAFDLLTKTVSTAALEFVDLGDVLGAYAAAAAAVFSLDFEGAQAIIAARKEERALLDEKIAKIWEAKEAQDALNGSTQGGGAENVPGDVKLGQGRSNKKQEDTKAATEALMEYRDEWDALLDLYGQEEEKNAELWTMKLAGYDEEYAAKLAQEQRLTEATKRGADERNAYERMSATEKAGIWMQSAATLAGSLSQMGQANNEKELRRQKALARLEIGINLASAIMKAYSQLGPIGGSAAAIGLVAIAARQNAAVSRMSIGGGAGGELQAPSSVAGSSPNGVQSSANEFNQQAQPQQAAGPSVTVNVNGSVVGANLEEIIANGLRNADKKDYLNITVNGQRAQIA